MEYVYYVNSRDHISFETCKMTKPTRSNYLKPKSMDGDWNYIAVWSDVKPHKLYKVLKKELGHPFELRRLYSYDQWADHDFQKYWLIENQWCNCYETDDTIALITMSAKENDNQYYYDISRFTSDSIDYDSVTPDFTNFENTFKEAKFRITRLSDYIRFLALAKRDEIIYSVEEF